MQVNSEANDLQEVGAGGQWHGTALSNKGKVMEIPILGCGGRGRGLCLALRGFWALTSLHPPGSQLFLTALIPTKTNQTLKSPEEAPCAVPGS